MYTHRFGKKIKLPSTIAIKHQLRKLMFEDLVRKAEKAEKAEVMARAEVVQPIMSETYSSLVGSKANNNSIPSLGFAQANVVPRPPG
jgi:hypothetical protein